MITQKNGSAGRNILYNNASGMGNVSVPKEYGYYGDPKDVTANGLYRRYVKWMRKKYGTTKEPMAFGEWIKWAKNNGLVRSKSHSWDGTEDLEDGPENIASPPPPVVDEVDVNEELKKDESALALQKADQKIHKTMLVLAMITVVVLLVGFVAGRRT